MIENQLPQIANLVAKGTLQVSVIYGKKLQGMVIKIILDQQRINSNLFFKLRLKRASGGFKDEIILKSKIF